MSLLGFSDPRVVVYGGGVGTSGVSGVTGDGTLGRGRVGIGRFGGRVGAVEKVDGVDVLSSSPWLVVLGARGPGVVRRPAPSLSPSPLS